MKRVELKTVRVGFPGSVILSQWAFSVEQVFGHVCWLVGSALDNRDYHDVDVVCIIPDDEMEDSD